MGRDRLDELEKRERHVLEAERSWLQSLYGAVAIICAVVFILYVRSALGNFEKDIQVSYGSVLYDQFVSVEADPNVRLIPPKGPSRNDLPSIVVSQRRPNRFDVAFAPASVCLLIGVEEEKSSREVKLQVRLDRGGLVRYRTLKVRLNVSGTTKFAILVNALEGTATIK